LSSTGALATIGAASPLLASLMRDHENFAKPDLLETAL
jgi:hypothetical protein